MPPSCSASLRLLRRLASSPRPLGLLGKRGLATSSQWVLRYSNAPPKISAEDAPRIVKSIYSDVELPECNLADFVWRDVEQWKDNTALVCGMTGRQYTFEMARDMSRKFGSALKRLGANKGDVMGMVVPNIPEFPIAFLGAAGAGLAITTMNPTYRPEEIARQLENSGARYVITIGLFLPNIRQACEIYKGIDKIIVLGMEDKPDDVLSFIEMVIYDDGSLYDADRECNAKEDIVVLPYSSGTTGPPKGVGLTHYNMTSNMAQINHPEMTMLRESKGELTDIQWELVKLAITKDTFQDTENIQVSKFVW